MGLDQYLRAKTKTVAPKPSRGAFDGLFPIAPASKDTTEIGYWRKAYDVSDYLRNVLEVDDEFNLEDKEISYDKVLEILDYANDSNLTSCNGAIYSINTETAGYIKATFAALSGVNTYSTVLTVCFTVIKDTTSTTKIDFSATEIYDSNLVSYIGGTCSNSISIEKIVPTVIVPKVYISDITTTLRSFDVVITAEGTSGIAAGDFLISYNSSKFSCTGITKMFDDAMLTIIKISPTGAIIQ